MTDTGFCIGCEEAIQVNATHATLPRFGDNEDAKEFTSYIAALKMLVKFIPMDQSGDKEEECRTEIEKEVRAEVHQFYAIGERGDPQVVRLWSVNPSVHELFEKGPGAFLQKRSVEAVLPNGTPASTIEDSQITGLQTVGSILPPVSQEPSTGTFSEESNTLVDTNLRLTEATIEEPSSPSRSFPNTPDESRSGYCIPESKQYLFRWVQ